MTSQNEDAFLKVQKTNNIDFASIEYSFKAYKQQLILGDLLSMHQKDDVEWQHLLKNSTMQDVKFENFTNAATTSFRLK